MVWWGSVTKQTQRAGKVASTVAHPWYGILVEVCEGAPELHGMVWCTSGRGRLGPRMVDVR